MLRSLLLYLSRQSWLRHWVETSSVAGRLTSRFVAGTTLDREIAVCRKLGSENILATIDYLGENVSSLAEAEMSRDVYLAILDRLAAAKLNATVSIKLSQFGLDLSEAACSKNVEALVVRAKQIGAQVEIDMESSPYVDSTLDIVTSLHSRYRCVRAVIQAYLRRSGGDIERLCQLQVPVRLCKGAYKEPASVAFEKKSEVDANYVRLMKRLLDAGTNPAIASHDEKIVQQGVAYARSKGIDAARFEFQMLYGIRRDLQRRLVEQGFRLRLYVPYGNAWYPYFMRRLAERPANLLFLLRNLLR